MNIFNIATILNSIAAVAGTLQATGVLNFLGPEAMTIVGALLAALNAFVHQMPEAAPAKAKK